MITGLDRIQGCDGVGHRRNGVVAHMCQWKKRAIATLAALAMSLPLLASPAESAENRVVRFQMMSQSYLESPNAGMILSLISTCPPGASAEPASTRLIKWGGANVSLIGREMWPSGMVTRWRVNTDSENVVTYVRDSVNCVAHVPRAFSRYDPSVRSIMRVWGPWEPQRQFIVYGGILYNPPGIRPVASARPQVLWTSSHNASVEAMTYAYGGVQFRTLACLVANSPLVQPPAGDYRGVRLAYRGRLRLR